MSKEYKNNIQLRSGAFGKERRENLTKETLQNGSPFPETLDYKDIDEAFTEWVDKDLPIVYDGEEIPTVALFSNQRFSEYMQSWENVDEKKNLVLNFKAITRENNPKGGSMYGNTRNVPGDRWYLMKRVEARDRNDRRYFLDYKMKQPFTIDLSYTLSIVTNKLELLNEFNEKVNEKFKSIDAYIRPRGHFIPMRLENISDESDYSINDRRFYSQSYKILVMAYIISKDSMMVEEVPYPTFKFSDQPRKSFADMEYLERVDCYDNNPYEYARYVINVNLNGCEKKLGFTMTQNLTIENITTENIRSYRTFINDNETELNAEMELKRGDYILFNRIIKTHTHEPAKILLHCYSKEDAVEKS